MHNEKPIYLDYMSTTPVDNRVIEKMLSYMGYNSNYGNPSSSTHIYGKNAAIAVENAREELANVINSEPESIVFTSGATESNNIAIMGAVRFYQAKGKHIITMQTEHKAVLDPMHQLEREGFTVTYLPPKPDGLLDLHMLEEAITNKTILVSIMHANNEIGVIQDIEKIYKIIAGKGILLHVDAAQSLGKLAIDLKKIPVDLMSFSGHKIYGPKGVGALYIKQNPRIRLQPLCYGGGQERAIRPGTLPTHQIVGMGYAAKLCEQERIFEQQRLKQYRDVIWNSIANIPGIYLNGSLEQRLSGNLNFRYEYAEGTELLERLYPLAVSTTSACASSGQNPSYVLKSIGLDDEEAFASIRLSVGRFTTDADVEYISKLLPKVLNDIKNMRHK